MSTKFVALLNPKLAVTRKTSAGSQRPATDSDMLMFSITYIALIFGLPTLEILRTKGYLCEILLDTTLYLQLSMFISLLGFFTIIVSCTNIVQRHSIDWSPIIRAIEDVMYSEGTLTEGEVNTFLTDSPEEAVAHINLVIQANNIQ